MNVYCSSLSLSLGSIINTEVPCTSEFKIFIFQPKKDDSCTARQTRMDPMVVWWFTVLSITTPGLTVVGSAGIWAVKFIVEKPECKRKLGGTKLSLPLKTGWFYYQASLKSILKAGVIYRLQKRSKCTNRSSLRVLEVNELWACHGSPEPFCDVRENEVQRFISGKSYACWYYLPCLNCDWAFSAVTLPLMCSSVAANSI